MKFRMNMLTHQIETQLIADAYTDRPEASACHWQRLTDHIENSLWCAMQHHGMAVNLNELHTLLGSDFVKEYHPLKEYLDGLPPWDGETDYIGRLAAMVHVKESPHSPLQQDKSRERNDLSETPVRFADILKRWMVSMIAAALNETVVNQVILTLIGRQGSYKTSFMQHILPPVLSEYYTTKSNSSRMTKDDLFTMTENLVINLEEIDTMPPSELNQLKAMVTQRYVDERRAYGRNKVHLPHVASFVATGNNLQFLTDDTGNRRWLPFEVEDIDSPWEADIPYEGIYSQTYALYQDVNFRYWFTDKEIQQLRGHVQQFEVPRPEYELILTYYRKPVGLERGSLYHQQPDHRSFRQHLAAAESPEGGPCHARAGLPASKGLQRKLLGGGGAHYRRGTALAAGRSGTGGSPRRKAFRGEYRTPLLTPLVEDMEDIFQTFHYMKVRSIFL